MRTDEELIDELEMANDGEDPDPITSHSVAVLVKIMAAIRERALPIRQQRARN